MKLEIPLAGHLTEESVGAKRAERFVFNIYSFSIGLSFHIFHSTSTCPSSDLLNLLVTTILHQIAKTLIIYQNDDICWLFFPLELLLMQDASSSLL